MRVPEFEVVSPFRPSGDQPQAIAGLVEGIRRGDRYQTLQGITGSGKTATIAWTIEAGPAADPDHRAEQVPGRPAGRRAEGVLPPNRVEYFVSYYDYYQPEAYVPSTDTYIEKDSSINDEIDRLRHATSSLLLRPDTIVVASVSCIYGLGSPDEYRDRILALAARRGVRPALLLPAGRPAVRAQRRELARGAVPGPRGHGRDPRGLRGAGGGSSSSATRWSGSGPSTS
jgi:excinuclease ABC subunit B